MLRTWELFVVSPSLVDKYSTSVSLLIVMLTPWTFLAASALIIDVSLCLIPSRPTPRRGQIMTPKIVIISMVGLPSSPSLSADVILREVTSGPLRLRFGTSAFQSQASGISAPLPYRRPASPCCTR